MIIGREEFQRREQVELAPYAQRSVCSRGRRHAERDDPYRTPFQRDRDRVIHSSAYRRLGNKTQVFISFEGEHYRTRLTHTEEATQIAVSVARALAANVDLTEAISRAHDLGHPPFGHAGESALAERMAAHGGFEHNAQTLRVVDELEQEYPGFRGLNLTHEVREGVMAHRGDGGSDLQVAGAVPLRPSVEAQIADVADEIAYSCHDLQDGLASGLLSRDDLMRTRPAWWDEALTTIGAYSGPLTSDLESRRAKAYLINRFISDLIQTSAANLRERDATSPQAVRALPERVINLSEPVRALRESLHAYLTACLYRHFEVVTMAEKARRLLIAIFDAYVANLEQAPEAIRDAMERDIPAERAICDHIASMTDRGAAREYRRLYDVDAHVLP